MLSTRRSLMTVALGACLALLAPLHVAGAEPRQAADPPRTVWSGTTAGEPAVYTVHGTPTPWDRTAVARTGVDVLGVGGDRMTVIATPGQVAAVRALGHRVEFVESLPSEGGPTGPTTFDFPPQDANYHNYSEMTAALRKAASDHPAIARLSSIGKSYQGRDLWMLKISDNAAADENEPEVLFTCNQHAREHLTVEMCLRIVQRFTEGYGEDANITQFVNSREIYVIPSVNPDGSEYDIETGRYRGWRKNRQPTNGTDPNRNWGYKWGCCGGSSGNPNSETYRGTAPFSAPETARVRDFVNSRVVGGKQQITAHIDFHTYSELVLWPWGYTYNDTGPGLNADEARTFQTLGRQMARTNGYTPEQSSDLYITDGSVNDWMWGEHKIWSYTFEMYPRSGSGLSGFYPPDEVIPRETARNDRAVDLLLSYADCVPRVIGKSCS
ncbi:carboxypeptidase T [Longimycelium tulufanense]|uniref:Zinc carboxypeptidase n=1 Tax=Longimycelium tulufanense TaxID=907463 RepID=A0A8J3FUR0_9PSEU|nr:M14 family metallopeptidase [Longimycelium tulufanense]GGM37520.1 carboxypeptidase T [Longimycelium tulufanense]